MAKVAITVSLEEEKLANAARFLLGIGVPLRSRNQLVSECVSYAAAFLKKDALLNGDKAKEFLKTHGLAGYGKQFENQFLIMEEVEKLVKERKKDESTVSPSNELSAAG